MMQIGYYIKILSLFDGVLVGDIFAEKIDEKVGQSIQKTYETISEEAISGIMNLQKILCSLDNCSNQGVIYSEIQKKNISLPKLDELKEFSYHI